MRYKIGLILILVLSVQCKKSIKEKYIAVTPIATSYEGTAYAGSITCTKCHEEIYRTHLKSAHYKTSQTATKDNILGSFIPGENSVHLNNGIKYEMSEIDEKLYQSAFVDEKYIFKAPFNLIIGSGTKGQTYLYQFKGGLYQLPVSYLVKNENWINSPSYSYDIIDFKRSISPNCLECHTTFAKNVMPEDFGSNHYIKKEIIFGINCESCHGPALKHVEFHLNNPLEPQAVHMADIQKLSRQQRLDACAKCHSGLRTAIKTPFSFKTGDILNDFYEDASPDQELATLDVHGNQYGLLSSSKCFIKSKNMDCSSCHNPHKNERNKREHFLQKCLSCHQDEIAHTFNLEIDKMSNCIDCHMPIQKSSALPVEALDKNKTDSISVRTHRIAIYDDVSKKLLDYIKTFNHSD